MEWEKYFEDNILKRGWEYYQRGKVVDFQVDGRNRTATVVEKDEYSVFLEFDLNGNLAVMECTCPYAESGEYCKHMAAVLYREQFGDVPTVFPKKKNIKKQKMIQEAQTGQVVDITPINLKELKTEIKGIISGYKRRGYIEYKDAYNCALEITDIMQANSVALIKRGQSKEAFDYSFYVLKKFCSTNMDDSAGGTGVVFDAGLETWERILQNITTEKYIFKKLSKYKATEDEWYLKDQAEHFLLTHFNEPEFSQQKMLYIENCISELIRNSDYLEYKLDYYLKCKLDLMRKIGVTEDELERFRKEYWNNAEIQADYIEEKIQHEQYKEAEKILLECLEQPFGEGVSTEYCREQLLNIYKETGDDDSYRKVLFDFVSQEHLDSIEKYEELKRLYKPEEWCEIRDRLFQGVWKESRELLPDILLKEGLTEKLLKLVLNYPGLYYADKYAKELIQDYADQIFEKYKNEFQKMIESVAATRSTYKAITQQLRQFNKTEQGKEFVRNIIEEWRIQYPKRKALQEELNKVLIAK